jgi:hypothetical protein
MGNQVSKTFQPFPERHAKRKPRVTRLGEFLLIGQFFTLNIVMIIAELA